MRRVIVAVSLVSSLAAADRPPEAFVTVAPGSPPELRAEIIGARPSADECTIIDGSSTLRGQRVIPYDSTQTVAIVFVMNGAETWIGGAAEHDEWDPSREERGALDGWKKAIDNFAWKNVGPAGSTFEVVTYSESAEVHVPPTPLATLSGDAFGRPKDYRNRFGTALVHGIELGLAELQHSRAARKVLVVVGDGNDTNNADAVVALPGLAKQATAGGIEIYAIEWKTALSSDGSAIASIVKPRTASSSTDAIAELATMTARTTDRETVAFGSNLAWDGKEHRLRLECPSLTIERAPVLPRWDPPTRGSSPTRYLLVGGLAVLAAGVVFTLRRAR